MFEEFRNTPRERLALPLKFGKDGRGLTRDISSSGLFFETDSAQRVGRLIDFEIDLDAIGGRMRLKARGKIVRIEPGTPMNGVALKLLTSRLEPVSD